MQFHFEVVDSTFGKFFILDSKHGLHYIVKNNCKKVKKLNKTYYPIKGLYDKSITKYFNNCIRGKNISKKLNLSFLDGTKLQKNVWSQIAKISYGKTISYSNLAIKMKHPKAIRAIATAVSKNPITVIIPCHRVIKKNGSIGDYAWGAKMKSKLLHIEGIGMADSIYRGGK